MDKQLTTKLQNWLNTPAADRDIETGRILVLQLTRSQILARNFQVRPKVFMPRVEYELNKFLKLRLADMTHAQVSVLKSQAKTIAQVHHLADPLPGTERTPVTKRIEKTDEFKKGKRRDHDQLPEEAKAAYIENLDIMRRMREAHSRLVIVLEEAEKGNKTICPDGDAYPFAKEIVDLDKKYHANWRLYDEATPIDKPTD